MQPADKKNYEARKSVSVYDKHYNDIKAVFSFGQYTSYLKGIGMSYSKEKSSLPKWMVLNASIEIEKLDSILERKDQDNKLSMHQHWLLYQALIDKFTSVHELRKYVLGEEEFERQSKLIYEKYTNELYQKILRNEQIETLK